MPVHALVRRRRFLKASGHSVKSTQQRFQTFAGNLDSGCNGSRPQNSAPAAYCMSPRSAQRFWDNDMHQNKDLKRVA